MDVTIEAPCTGVRTNPAGPSHGKVLLLRPLLTHFSGSLLPTNRSITRVTFWLAFGEAPPNAVMISPPVTPSGMFTLVVSTVTVATTLVKEPYAFETIK